MSDTPEPLSAILAEMRKSAKDSYAEKTAKRLEDHEATGTRDALDIKDAIQCLRDDDKYLLDIADRIEAAAKRERNAHTNDIHDALYMATGIPGNAAALREALKHAREVLALNGFVEPVVRCDAALAAPARNCDRFATAEEARRAFESAHSHGIVHNLYTAAFDWLFATAEGGDHA